MSKSQMAFKPQMNPKSTSQPSKDQGVLDICCQFQWETQGKTCDRRFSQSRPWGDHIPRELNNLELWVADIGEAYTHEKLFIIAGAVIQELECFILVFNNALYGLKSSGMRHWHPTRSGKP